MHLKTFAIETQSEGFDNWALFYDYFFDSRKLS